MPITPPLCLSKSPIQHLSFHSPFHLLIKALHFPSGPEIETRSQSLLPLPNPSEIEDLDGAAQKCQCSAVGSLGNQAFSVQCHNTLPALSPATTLQLDWLADLWGSLRPSHVHSLVDTILSVWKVPIVQIKILVFQVLVLHEARFVFLSFNSLSQALYLVSYSFLFLPVGPHPGLHM